MNSRITVYTPMGMPLGEIVAPCNRTWVLNGYADAEFLLPSNDNKALDEYIRFGNLIRVEHPQLPTWEGVIDVPREWNEKTIKVKAYGLSIILDWRYGPVSDFGHAGWPLDRFLAWMLNMTNRTYANGIPIYAGEVNNPNIKVVVNTAVRLSEIFKKLDKRFGVDWELRGKIDTDNQLRLYINAYDGLMGRVTNLYLDNHNTLVSDPIMREEGPIYNHVTVYSEEVEGGGRNYAFAIDNDSIAKYGLRATAEQAKGSGTAVEGLQIAADYLLMGYKEPRRMIAPTVLNVGDAFDNLELGNVFTYNSTQLGFAENSQVGTSESARIIGMEYDELKDTVQLVADLRYKDIDRKQFLYEWARKHGRRV